MQVQLTEIPEEGLELLINDVAWFPGNEIRRTGDLQARFFLERRRERLMASGSIDLVYVFNCDRCLEEYTLPRIIEFRLTLERAEDSDALEKSEHQCDSNEMDVEFFEGSVVDIGFILEQQVLLANPLKRLCSDDCLGLCPGCGHNLNQGPCTCADGLAESPFNILRRLSK